MVEIHRLHPFPPLRPGDMAAAWIAGVTRIFFLATNIDQQVFRIELTVKYIVKCAEIIARSFAGGIVCHCLDLREILYHLFTGKNPFHQATIDEGDFFMPQSFQLPEQTAGIQATHVIVNNNMVRRTNTEQAENFDDVRFASAQADALLVTLVDGRVGKVDGTGNMKALVLGIIRHVDKPDAAFTEVLFQPVNVF